jgi:peroxiredoxin Q/BCP
VAARYRLPRLRAKSCSVFLPIGRGAGMIKEFEKLRNRPTEFEVVNIRVVGVWKDSVKRHYKFKAEYQLPFSLISNGEVALCDACNVWRMKKLYGKKYVGIVLSTYLIDESGHIQGVWDKGQVKGHVDATLEVGQAF